MWDKTGGSCFHCGKAMHPVKDFTVDHLTALALGGDDDIENLVPSCRTCNSQKNAKTLERFKTGQQEAREWQERCDREGVVTLRQLRERRGVSPVEVAAALGMSLAAIYNLESGKVDPLFSTARKIAALFDVSMDTLEFRDTTTGPKPRTPQEGQGE